MAERDAMALTLGESSVVDYFVARRAGYYKVWLSGGGVETGRVLIKSRWGITRSWRLFSGSLTGVAAVWSTPVGAVERYLQVGGGAGVPQDVGAGTVLRGCVVLRCELGDWVGFDATISEANYVGDDRPCEFLGVA